MFLADTIKSTTTWVSGLYSTKHEASSKRFFGSMCLLFGMYQVHINNTNQFIETILIGGFALIGAGIIDRVNFSKTTTTYPNNNQTYEDGSVG